MRVVIYIKYAEQASYDEVLAHSESAMSFLTFDTMPISLVWP